MEAHPPETRVAVEDLSTSVEDLDLKRAAAVYREHGCLVVRGLMKPYIAALATDIAATVDQSIALLDRAERRPEGWVSPNGSLFIPAPAGYKRDRQIMTVGVSYQTSAALLRAAMDPAALDILETILGPNIELFGNGQSLVKEPVGGHPKHLHQDSAYFEHRYEGPVAILTYVVDTDLVNGALHVVPGSHQFGQLRHVDTFSHLGLDENEWPWEAALPIVGQAGDSIFFNVKTIHGSKQNHSNTPRPVFIIRYRRPDDYAVVRATTTANRAEAEKRARQARRENEPQGLMVRGFRPYADPDGAEADGPR
ncbi:MAG: phytanoyl-CoA dioxygenase family protein [Caldilineaceae bacterium]|nr:phytanoyl-CoA dioxygenase family protein [Caldilineaceae bacterium]